MTDPLQVPPELRGRLIGNAVARRKRGAERLRIIQLAAASGYVVSPAALAPEAARHVIKTTALLRACLTFFLNIQTPQ